MEDTQMQELRDLVAQLTDRIAGLEAQVSELQSAKEIPEADLIAIGAAVAAYFGHRARVRAIRYGSQTRWAAATRTRVHDRSVPHVR
ncbi:hypothetical protein H5392_01695 [Tessaracoccus sp. MC1865]|uniref:hypothetical protein n=1 Tax=unclassified Tessaracoccus TaxID=2635419 RepID=UPI00096C9D45|nr:MULTISPECIES: hypothetical protein [unclassified Tessaracoccus]MBB1482570.1 hypothetical protein [Tessaracoccus sp. MC1865]MBB1509784.1 hypothetical protein [Tessaracoccus sp. MC1756]OMG54203.1 hypothetical protein BJN44_10905 [Tessaracoccus sp. ZS01]QTO37977.1 hypothetical protein J7D54_02395 [Tessaracoccus sp. MC1865]